MSNKPIGSCSLCLVSAQLDREIVIVRNQDYWGQKARVNRVRFIVVPDTTTRALELRKGSADIAINALTADMILAISHESKLEVLRAPGTVLSSLAFNPRRPICEDVGIVQG